MSALYNLVSLVVEGATWAACIFCFLRVSKKISDDDLRRWVHWLSPVWAGASLVLVAAYSVEVFIAVYGANEYEGVSFLKRGSPISQASFFVHISLSIVFYLLPAVLLFQKARQSIALICSITSLCFLGIIAMPRFEKEEPNQSPEPTAGLRPAVAHL